MTINDAAETISQAAIGNRAFELIQAARKFTGDENRSVLIKAAGQSGLSRAEIEAALAVADRG